MIEPLVTIITTSYNRFEKIFETMNSVFFQDYPNIEYIISDDASKNFPMNEITEYIRRNCPENINCIVLQNKKNLGSVRNMNQAYHKASGEYIFNLSTGDIFYSKNVVKKIVERFVTLDANVIVASRIFYRGNYEPICLLPHVKEREIIEALDTDLMQYKAFIMSTYYDMASGSAMYFSKKIIEKMGYFDERYVLWEDGPFLAKYLMHNKLTFAYDVIAIWYEEGGVSTSSRYGPPQMQKDVELFNDCEKMKHIDLFSHKEKRMILYRNKRFKYRNSKKRILVYLLFFPEVIKYLIYSHNRRRRYNEEKKYFASKRMEIGNRANLNSI